MSEFQEPEDIDELRPYMEDGDEDVEVVRKTRTQTKSAAPES